MEQRLGDEFEALIISVQKYGCFVELLDLFVEGLLPIAALEEAAGARCVFRERDHAIVALLGGDSGRRGSRGKRPRRSPGNLATASVSAPNALTRCAAAWNSRWSASPDISRPFSRAREPRMVWQNALGAGLVLLLRFRIDNYFGITSRASLLITTSRTSLRFLPASSMASREP